VVPGGLGLASGRKEIKKASGGGGPNSCGRHGLVRGEEDGWNEDHPVGKVRLYMKRETRGERVRGREIQLRGQSEKKRRPRKSTQKRVRKEEGKKSFRIRALYRETEPT